MEKPGTATGAQLLMAHVALQIHDQPFSTFIPQPDDIIKAK